MTSSSRCRRWAALLAAGICLAPAACTTPPEPIDLMSSIDDGPVDELGLLEGKPYDGAHIRFLNCCDTTPQFAALRERTDAEFTERTGITVEWANIPYNAYLQKIVAESAIGGGTYDVIAWPDAFGPMLRIGVQPLDEAMADTDVTMDAFPEAFQQASRLGTDETYGIPFRGFSYNLFYRTDTYREFGFEPPETWPEYVEQLESLQEEGDRYPMAGQYGRGGGQNLYTWLSMLWSNGADVFDENGDPAFTSPAGLEATEQYIDLLRTGLTPQQSSSWGELESSNAMLHNNADTTLTWSWHQEDFDNPDKADPEALGDIGVASVPGFEGQESTTYAYTWLVGVLNSSEQQGPAWEYVKWMTNEQTEQEIALDKSDPATSTGITVHLANMRDERVNEVNGGLPEIQEQSLENARTVPQTDQWPRVMDILEVAVNEMAHGAPVGPRLEEAADEVRALD
ncbi:ABC transporter substrate-binding protein [Nocardiopsis nanhaiensis]